MAYRLARVDTLSIKRLPSAVLRRRVRHQLLWALRNVTLSVPRGDVLAVVGANGAGKSTLLRLLARVFRPSRGRVIVRGRIAPLLDLGAGFDPEATALENVVLYGALLGRRPGEMRERASEIVDWAGVADFADVPLVSFSSGMLARLAFAVATIATPEILLIDEVLGVGDAAFQNRSGERIHELVNSGSTVVAASHAIEQLRPMASHAIWLDHGMLRGQGSFDAVVEDYLAAEPGPITASVG